MLSRRNFIASSFAFLGLDSVISVNKFDSNDISERQARLQYSPRYQVIFSYEEWQIINEKLSPDENESKFRKQALVRFSMQDRLKIILTEPEKVLGCLTQQERELYQAELSMLNPAIDRRQINEKYNLKLNSVQFQTDGAKLLWFLDRYYSYRKSQEK